MDIGKAVDAMRAGKAVRRAVWVQHPAVVVTDYLCVRMANIPGFDPVLVSSTTGPTKHPYNPTHADLLATDWEIAD